MSGERSVGATLYCPSGLGGARALEAADASCAGGRSDLVELDPDHPVLAEQTLETALDA